MVSSKVMVIVANGVLGDFATATAIARAADCLIAANGGLRHCLDLKVWPHLLIGDLDSLAPPLAERLEARGCRIIKHAVEKDYSDLELALLLAKEQHPRTITILGGLGARWDMSLTNLLMLAHPHFRDLAIELVDGRQRVWLITPQRPARVQAPTGTRLSLISVDGNAEGVQASGLQYPLQNDTLQLGSSRGVSNVLRSQEAHISLTRGSLLVVVDSQDVDGII